MIDFVATFDPHLYMEFKSMDTLPQTPPATSPGVDTPPGTTPNSQVSGVVMCLWAVATDK